MKALKLNLLVVLLLFLLVDTKTFAQKYEYKVITIVESIIPMGIGRSRMIESTKPMNVQDFTVERVNGRITKKPPARRDLRVKDFYEIKLLNFFSATGINFSNIATNDAIIASKINQLAEEGWELVFVTSGVESDAGKDDGEGIFITRLFSRRAK